jgi:glycerol-3-phosphate acyltransferase PlsY
VVVAAFFRYSSLAALAAAAFAPFYQALIWGADLGLLAIAAMSLLLVWRHEGNIRKLLAGTESRLGQKTAAAGAAAGRAKKKQRSSSHHKGH